MLAILQTLLTKYQAARKAFFIQSYLRTGRKPWNQGYWEYREDFIRSVLQDVSLLECFKNNQKLPAGYGLRLDERVVEYPWVLSRISNRVNYLLDAGSTLNYSYLLKNSLLLKKKIVIYNLAPETTAKQPNVSYIYGDLRQIILKDELFEEIVCISTLEHIGLDNSMIYVQDEQYKEARIFDYLTVLKELWRLLAPGGQLFFTVPYGRYQNHKWLQQFDARLLEDAINAFSGQLESQTFYRYTPTGWNIASATECIACEYYDIHARSDFDPDYAAAARAVACVQLKK